MKRSVLATLAAALLLGPPAAADDRAVQLVQEVSRTVETQFFDPHLNGADWVAARAAAVQEARGANDWPARQAVVMRMLSHLHASHTAYYSVDDPSYYQLLGIFSRHPGGQLGEQLRKLFGPQGQPVCPGIGALFTRSDRGWFVRGVLEGSPAERAGLKRGDLILSADGQPLQPVASFRGKTKVRLSVQSTSDVAGRDVQVSVQSEGPDLFLDALKHSARIIDWHGHKVAYLHAWSYAGDQFQEAIVDAISQKLSVADALVLDLRDGWGGATPDFLNLFDKDIPETDMTFRDGHKTALATTWHKPAVMLIDEGSRSGKEILAYGFHKHHIGLLVGKPTAGAVLGGRPYPMDAGGVLYLAVADVHVDGDRIEGHPVQPDVDVARPLPFSHGSDPQLEAALGTLFR